MARVSWVHFGMVLLGVVLIIGSLFLGIVATEYEITHEGSTENMTKVLDEIDQYGMTRYEELSAEGQRIVDGTIDGTQYRFDTGDERALMWSDGRVVARAPDGWSSIGPAPPVSGRFSSGSGDWSR